MTAPGAAATLRVEGEHQLGEILAWLRELERPVLLALVAGLATPLLVLWRFFNPPPPPRRPDFEGETSDGTRFRGFKK